MNRSIAARVITSHDMKADSVRIDAWMRRARCGDAAGYRRQRQGKTRPLPQRFETEPGESTREQQRLDDDGAVRAKQLRKTE